MRDMKEGIQKAITDLNVGRGLSDRDKGMIEAGYIQCAMRENQWHQEPMKPNSDREVIVELENGFTIIATWMSGFNCWMSVNGEVKGVQYWCEKPERKK